MAQDLFFDVDGLTYAGLAWGPEDGIPVLALHGWMDHAGSFQELAPLLTGCRVVALDLSGQGHSGHRAAHATYNIWDDLPQIAKVLDQLGWDTCVLLGHSRGANISALFAAAQPQRVRALISLDCLVPEPNDPADFAKTLGAFIQQTADQSARPARSFPTRADYITRRAAQGNSQTTSEVLADRALVGTPEGVQMRADRRLFASSAVKLTQPQIESVLRAIPCPVLNIWGDQGLKAQRPAYADLATVGARLIADYEAHDLPGDHHFHLDPSCAPAIAAIILDFLARK